MTDIRIGETDGVGWMRRATTILLEHRLPAFPGPQSLGQDDRWHWHAAPDVAAQLRSLHFPSEAGAAPVVAEELLGYRLDVDEGYPAGTLAIVREDRQVVEAAQ